jgi:hypothetical protein
MKEYRKYAYWNQRRLKWVEFIKQSSTEKGLCREKNTEENCIWVSLSLHTCRGCNCKRKMYSGVESR